MRRHSRATRGVRGARRARGERRHFTSDDVHFVESSRTFCAHAVSRADADEALRTSELRYRMAARATRDAMYDWDIVNDRCFWSEGVTLLFGIRPAVSDRDRLVEDYIHPDDRAAILSSVEETCGPGRMSAGRIPLSPLCGRPLCGRAGRGFVEYAATAPAA
jgi:PAS domain-containing protein